MVVPPGTSTPTPLVGDVDRALADAAGSGRARSSIASDWKSPSGAGGELPGVVDGQLDDVEVGRRVVHAGSQLRLLGRAVTSRPSPARRPSSNVGTTHAR